MLRDLKKGTSESIHFCQIILEFINLFILYIS